MTEPNRPARTGQTFSVDDVPVDLTEIMRSVAPQAVERIALRVQLEVPAYAGPIDGDRHRLVLGTVDQAVSHFLDVVEHKPTSDARVFRLVGQLGQAEAAEGNSLDSLRAAHHIATQAAWEEIRKALKETDADPEVLNRLVDGLFVYVDRLLSSVAAGHKSVSRGTDNTLQQARRKLLMSMLAGHPPERYAQHLAAADWEPPEELAVAAGALAPDVDYASLPKFGREVLVGIIRQRITVVARPEQVHSLSQQLMKAPGVSSVAVSWTLPINEVRDACRWACRALDLADQGLINEPGIIDCSEHRLTLWLHADPALARLAAEELLAPLLAQKPHYKLMLAETLMCWLQARESAPVLAERLNVHSNTVLTRLRHLRDLFGNQLLDPQQTLALLSALEVVVPIWREQLQSGSTRKSPT